MESKKLGPVTSAIHPYFTYTYIYYHILFTPLSYFTFIIIHLLLIYVYIFHCLTFQESSTKNSGFANKALRRSLMGSFRWKAVCGSPHSIPPTASATWTPNVKTRTSDISCPPLFLSACAIPGIPNRRCPSMLHILMGILGRIPSPSKSEYCTELNTFVWGILRRSWLSSLPCRIRFNNWLHPSASMMMTCT